MAKLTFGSGPGAAVHSMGRETVSDAPSVGVAADLSGIRLTSPSTGTDDFGAERPIAWDQLLALINDLPGAFLVTDKARVIQFASSEIEPLFGYQSDELVGQPIDILLPEGVRERHTLLHRAYYEHSSRRAMGSDLDVNGLTKHGQLVPLDIGLSPMRTARGTVVVAAIRDLRPLREGQARLRAAREEADRANHAKSKFLAAASHDLRQPLQTISLLHGYLEKRLADPADALIVTKLNAAVSHMAELLDTLLDINQIESGSIQAEIADVSLADFLADVAGEFAPQAAEKGLQLRWVPSSAIVRSDRRLLTRMVGNLLSNAIKYTERGNILLGCRRRGRALRIEVLDTGVGIPVANRQQIFEEFYRVDRTDGDKLGLGLGLSIVQRFAQLLGHGVEVESFPNKGSAFAITISDPIFGAARQRPRGADRSAHAKPPSVLLVEDDPGQLDALRMLLELEGYAVITARRGDEAMAHLHATPPLRPDFIVADYNLPGGLTGLDIIQSARTVANADLPAMLVSGDRRRTLLSDFDKAGVVFIAKPVKIADLLAGAAALAAKARPDWRRPAPANPQLAKLTHPVDGATIAVIDDDPGVRGAICLMLSGQDYVAAPFGSAEAFLSDPGRSRYRCIIVDLDLPKMTGLDLHSLLKAEQIDTPIIFVTGRGDLSSAVQAMRNGAADFLQKPVRAASLMESVTDALGRGDQAAKTLKSGADVAARLATLTTREREVMVKVAAGEMNKNIATDLGVSQRTAEHHRQNVMRKMGAGSLAKLVLMVGATRSGA